jgi:hypothetical protein
MNGPGHYREAERLLKEAAAADAEGGWQPVRWIQLAQVHATLACAAATAVSSSLEARAWADVAGTKLSDPA